MQAQIAGINHKLNIFLGIMGQVTRLEYGIHLFQFTLSRAQSLQVCKHQDTHFLTMC